MKAERMEFTTILMVVCKSSHSFREIRANLSNSQKGNGGHRMSMPLLGETHILLSLLA